MSDPIFSARATGSPEAPIADAALDAKFRDCAANAVSPLTADAVDPSIAFVRVLPGDANIAGLLRTIAGCGPNT